MKQVRRPALVTLALAVLGGLGVSAADRTVAAAVWVRYWSIAPDYWSGGATWIPPEQASLDARHLNDLGVAFSGGGTRSAAATIGQLRGLRANGWLQHVRYVTAVSGGSWAAVPFTYSTTDLDTLLGRTHQPFELSRQQVEQLPEPGSIARAIAQSRLLAPGALEAARLLAASERTRQRVPPQVLALLDRFFGGRSSETYANLLSRFFIAPFIPGGGKAQYAWDAESLTEWKALNGALSIADVVPAAPGRPFLIVGGTMIQSHPALEYPRLIPVEYTPLYTGVRQQYGANIGGTYITPYAYNAAAAGEVRRDRVRVTLRGGSRPFTLADVIASSGAAPLLAIFRNAPEAVRRKATMLFPAFNHFTVRPGERGLSATPIVEDVLHGDGGFSDNLGIMPLLARRVRNIIVFVNGAGPFTKNKSIESMFWRLQQQDDLGGDRSMNGPFEPARYWEVEAGLRAAVAAGGPAVYCGTGWRVQANEFYNVAPYDGLNICWVHNERSEGWIKQLPDRTQELIATAKGFRNFPWFATFEQNKPELIRLTPAQVNLLTEATSWSLTSAQGRAALEGALGSALR